MDASRREARPAPRSDSAEPRQPVHGLVLQIQRMSTEDGPGLRSTAFLKGCPLACSWCHNPESIRSRPEVQWVGLRCIAGSAADGCGACLAACGRGALSRGADGAMRIDRERCAGCGACAEACPGGAMELLGTAFPADRLATELLKDRAYYAHSGRGGVTLSGGEASVQGAFSLEVLRLLKEAGVHTALDTCGLAAWERLSCLYPFTDLVLYDLKEIDPDRHREFTGQGNGTILENFRRTVSWMAGHGTPSALWIRTPVIPGATDTEENLAGLGRFVASAAGGAWSLLERWELCAFNNLCADKYRRLGGEWAYAGRPLVEDSTMAVLAAAARRGLREIDPAAPDIVSCTGSTRIGPERN